MGPDPEIHVSGVGLRLPPALQDIGALWSHLIAGGRSRHRVSADGPGDRRLTDDALSVSHEGLLADIASFDPEPFRISHREAATMDPQQRLLLECAWECLADAGYAWDSLRDESVGVFVGAYAQDWLVTALDAVDGAVDAATGTGTALTILANRLSYLLDVHGPSLTVDTACASSLTAVHLAVRALRAGDCDRALVAGVAIGHHAGYRALNGGSLPLSATGSIRPFDVRADGMVRGEGVVALLLEREEVSRGGRHGRILGSAIGHGGRTNGLTAPSGAGHARIIRRALEDSGIGPEQVRYVEAHGTGTLLGDPIEARALHSVYGGGGHTCDVGSVKGTFGHAEAAAGIVGLLSALLVARHGIVPGQAGFAVPNPAAGFEGSGLTVSADTRPVPAAPGSYATAVSSLGFGGATAHVVVGSPPDMPSVAPGPADRGEGLLLLASAATRAGLTAQHDAIRHRLGELPDQAVAEFVALQSRVAASLPRRAGWHAEDVTGLRRALAQQSPVAAEAQQQGRRILYVFSGQGASWHGMGAELWRLPALRKSVDRWENEVEELLGWSLGDRLAGDVDIDTESAQVCTAAVQLAIVEILAARGIRPAAVVGHSMGEAVAAVAAGAMSSRDAFAVLAARAAAIERLARGGRMLSINLPVEEVAPVIAGIPEVAVGVVNGPRATVVSGDRDVLDRLAGGWTDRGVKVAHVPVDYAFHGPALAGARVDVNYVQREPEIPWISTVTGEPIALPAPDHWSRTVSDTVQLTKAVEFAVKLTGARVVVEVSPRPVLVRHLVSLLGPGTAVLHTMSREDPPSRWIPELASGLFTGGAAVDVARLVGHRPAPGGVVRPEWQRRRFWIDSGEGASVRDGGASRERGVVPAPASAGPATETDGRPSVPELAEFIAAQMAPLVEGQPMVRVPVDEPTAQWEIPSLAVVTIRNAIETVFGLTAPLPVLLGGESPLTIARRLGEREIGDDPDRRRLESALERIDDLDPDEIAELLAELEPSEEG